MTGAVDREVPLGLADTSLFIAVEQKRPLRGTPPTRIAVSIVTIGELRLGVLAATDVQIRARRLETLTRADLLDPIAIDRPVATAWAELVVALREAGRRMPVNDSWIAATAIARNIPVVSPDADYDDIPGLTTIRV